MEPLGSCSSSSSASSTTKYLSQTIQPTKGSTSNSKQLPHHHSSIHSVQKSSSKPWKKPAVAPLPPTPPRIYKVDPINFRELVQRLTCAPEFMETRSLQSVASPPIDIRVSSVPNHFHSSPEIGSPFSVMYKDLLDTLELSPMPRHQKVHDSTVDSSETELAVPVFPSLVFPPSAQPRDPVPYHPRKVFLR